MAAGGEFSGGAPIREDETSTSKYWGNEKDFMIPQPRLRHQDVIFTLFAMYARPPHSVLPVGALITLMGDLGFESQGVRSAVSRLKRKGILVSVRHGDHAAYSLDPSMANIMRDGDERIFSETRPDSGGKWVLATFSVPESQRSLRHQIRSALRRLGYGQAGQGLWIAPAANLHEAQISLERQELSQYVEFFIGNYAGHSDLSVKIGQWWDLEALNASFDEFLELYSGLSGRWREACDSVERPTPLREREAFQIYAPMLTVWRRMPYMVPPLPADAVPEDWNGPRVRAIFHESHQLLSGLAERYVEDTLVGYEPSTRTE
ncbi:PaaX family transcriptional regulator C-terminal domain-containing protein [Brevibacterium linens]|uniref:PaaX family transcriptional regulator n=1 Tax=Brevibacterium linens TaxID=1703 RepID=UPI003BF4CB6A